ncbi:alpha/beta hydrolase fold domain-containing protein [Paraburkholderia sp. BR13439]|uniref:alpha/beta hydrolase fold domain-containing protein n=1 Tax=unclassified Paraburkholderia TaxID=2615204 RepID=UPI0034CD87C8
MHCLFPWRRLGVGDIEDFEPMARSLSRECGYALLPVDYRPAPEAPFPAAVHDACHAIE